LPTLAADLSVSCVILTGDAAGGAFSVHPEGNSMISTT